MTLTEISEIVEAFIWVRATLVADTQLNTAIGGRVYPDIAPLDAAYPFITMQVLDTEDYRIVGPNTLWSTLQFLIRVTTDQKTVYNIRTIDARMNRLLHAQSGETTDAKIVECVRLRPHHAPTEESEGVFYSHLGGEYRLRVQPKNLP